MININTCEHLWNNQNNKDIEHIHHPQIFTQANLQCFPQTFLHCSQTLFQATTAMTFVNIGYIAFSRILYKWKHTKYSFCVTSFIIMIILRFNCNVACFIVYVVAFHFKCGNWGFSRCLFSILFGGIFFFFVYYNLSCYKQSWPCLCIHICFHFT